MRKLLFTTVFISLFLAVSFGSEPQEIVRFGELQFNSYFEEMAFYNFEQDSADVLMLLAAIDPDVNNNIFEGFKKDLIREYHKLNSRKFQRVKEKKKIDLIYKHVNSQVLTRYREKILFPHLFVNGTFNCLTASAYYGFLMDSLGIDYDFRETYDHVHPVAYPNSLQIKIETTDRFSGIEYYDDKLKRNYTEYLMAQNIISREEYYSNSTEELFNRYFLPQSNIGMLELAGLHYMNDALYKYNAQDYTEAFEQVKKAYFLYPSERMMMIFQFMLSAAMGEADFYHLDDAWLLVYLSRLPEDKVNPENISSGFLYLTQELLFNSSMTEYYDNFFNFLEENLAEGIVKTTIQFNYYFHRGKSEMVQYRFNDALNLYLKAFQINPNNMELNSLIISSLVAKFENSTSAAMVYELENYALEWPLLSEHGMFKGLQMMAYLVMAEESFDFGKEQEGLSFLEKFEKIHQKNPGVEINLDHVGDAYSAAAVYYFKKYNNEKAIRYIEKGLKIAPQNYELRYRLKSITDS